MYYDTDTDDNANNIMAHSTYKVKKKMTITPSFDTPWWPIHANTINPLHFILANKLLWKRKLLLTSRPWQLDQSLDQHTYKALWNDQKRPQKTRYWQ